MFNVGFRFEEQQTTIEFPCDEEYLSVKFSELGVENKLNTSQYMIGTDYYILSRLVTDYVDVDELNYLAKRLGSLDERELNTFEAVCEARVSRNVKDMINVTFNIYNYTLVQDLRSMESIGEAHFRSVHIGWKPEEAEKADFAKIGRELIKSGKGIMTERGMLFEHDDAQFMNQYDGQNFPEYMYDQCMVSAVLERDGKAEYAGKDELIAEIERREGTGRVSGRASTRTPGGGLWEAEEPVIDMEKGGARMSEGSFGRNLPNRHSFAPT